MNNIMISLKSNNKEKFIIDQKNKQLRKELEEELQTKIEKIDNDLDHVTVNEKDIKIYFYDEIKKETFELILEEIEPITYDINKTLSQQLFITLIIEE